MGSDNAEIIRRAQEVFDDARACEEEMRRDNNPISAAEMINILERGVLAVLGEESLLIQDDIALQILRAITEGRL